MFLHTGEIDYLNDELQPVLIIDGGVETPIGVFVPARSQRPQKATARTSTAWRPMTAASSWQAKTETLLHWSAGTKYTRRGQAAAGLCRHRHGHGDAECSDPRHRP
ncbi:MAG: hypothetical protein ACLUEK_02580 [Oscillospiraceae bacterium]